ncbi:luminal binding protein 5-like protein [Tanacetum coccineum]
MRRVNSLSSLGTEAEYVGLSGVETEGSVVLPSVQRVIDENDERLKGLKKDYGEDFHRAVAIPVEHTSPQSYGTSSRAEKLLYKKVLLIF